MIIIASYKLSNNKVAERRDLESIDISSFMGVDYTSSSINIVNYHASDILNLLKKNNVLQKRNGWKQVLNITNKYLFNDGEKINGIWYARILNNGNYKDYYVIHIGKSLYLLNNFDTNDFNKITLEKINVSEDIPIKNEKSWGIVANDRIYILCGSYIVIKFKFDDSNNLVVSVSRVYDDEDTYIPLTTIGISDVSTDSTINRLSYDDPNMLTNWRYNSCNTSGGFKTVQKSITETDESGKEIVTTEVDKLEEYGKEFELDSLIDPYHIIETTATLKYLESNKIKEIELVTVEDNVYAEGKKYWYAYYLGYYDNENKFVKVGRFFNLVIKEEDNGETKKYYSVKTENTKIILENEYKNPNISIDNFKIKFYVENEDYKLIEECTFGVLYGANNNRNRLFLTGNKNSPNTDYHSSQRNIYANENDVDLQDNQDFTYFSPYDYCNYGTKNSSIMGYQIMGDGSLAVMKEESNNEPTLYFRKSTYLSKTISFGDNQEVVVNYDTYPMLVGNIGNGLIVKNGLFNLDNDIVYLSKNGVFGISSTISASTLASDYQYAYIRSRLINNKLNDLSYVSCCLYDHKFFITTKDKENKYITFIGDGRYKYKLNDSVDNEYEYEWFRLDNINADEYFIVNNHLYFANSDGLFYFDLESDNYSDINYCNSETGSITCQYNQNNIYSEIAVSKEFFNKNFNKNSMIKFNKNYYLFVCTFEDTSANEDGYYEIDNELMEYALNNNNLVMIKTNTGSIIPSFVKRREFSANEYSFYLDKEMENKLELNTYSQFGVSIPINVNDYYNISFEYDSKGNITDIEYILGYNNIPLIIQEEPNIYPSALPFSLDITASKSEIIPCYYLTKSFNCGQSLYSKVLRFISTTNDTELFSKVNFGIITKKTIKEFESNYISGTNGLSQTYSNIFNADLTTRRFATSFTKQFMIKFNYIQFVFYNNSEENCVINNLTALYTYGFLKKGAS